MRLCLYKQQKTRRLATQTDHASAFVSHFS